MKLSAQYYAIDQDPTRLEAYKLAHTEFQTVLRQFTAMQLTEEVRAALEAIRKSDSSIYDAVTAPTQSPNLKEQLRIEFDELSRRNQTLAQLSNRMIEQEVERLTTYAERAKNEAYWQPLGVVLMAALLIAYFAYAIARPIRDLDDAINRLGQGKLARRIVVAGPRDIRQLGEQLDWLRQRLISLEDQKTRFFQHVSHELKTPLTALREGSDLLSDEVVGSLTPEQREVTRILKQNSLTLERLIQDLLTYSQSQSADRIAQKTALNIKPLQLKDLIDDVVETQKIAIVAKALKIHRESEKTSVLGDADKLRVVIDNLLSNAVKYSPPGGKILIRLGKRYENAIIEVIDEGPGIATEDREKIFDPFYRSKSAVATGTKGTGLGLAIVRDYVEMHQGTVSSIAAPGARFRVVLPRQLRTEQ
jgi:two-component system sensor histidine kinase GlrK